VAVAAIRPRVWFFSGDVMMEFPQLGGLSVSG
jgi:hypothetical protein